MNKNRLVRIKSYINAHVLIFACFSKLLAGKSKKGNELHGILVRAHIIDKLRKKYSKKINQYKDKVLIKDLPQSTSNKVWICWFQGMENAPQIVKICYQSMLTNLKDREVILVTKANLNDYITLPEFILDKYEKGIISNALFSDLIRLELLINYGGTWIDSTVFCSGDNIPDYFFDSELFLYQELKPSSDGQPTLISSWFINSCSNNSLLLLTRALLYDYLKEKNKVVDYYIFHDFFQLAAEVLPDEFDKIIPFSRQVPHILFFDLFKKFDEKRFKAVIDMTPFHKLSYKNAEKDCSKDNTYYKYILENYPAWEKV